MGDDPRATARGKLPATAGASAGNPEARRWDAAVGHPHRARPVHSAVPTSGAATAFRSHLLTAQLRLPTGAARPRRRVRGATVHSGRPALGGRRGPREVLRPRQPRCADGTAGETDRGPTSAETDPSLALASPAASSAFARRFTRALSWRKVR